MSGNHSLAALYAQSSLDRIEYLKKCLFFYQLIVIGMQSAIGMIGALSALEHLYQGPGGPQHTWGCGMLALPGQASTASATFPMVPEEKHIKGTYLVLMVEG